MSLQQPQLRPTLVQQLAQPLKTIPEDQQNALLRRRALMYAEAIDEADEADALFRFGPKLRACLDSLGLDLPSLPGADVPGAPRSTAA